MSIDAALAEQPVTSVSDSPDAPDAPDAPSDRSAPRHRRRRRTPVHARARGRGRTGVSNVALGLVLSVLSWHLSAKSLLVAPGLDPSWKTTLETAANNRTHFGTHVIFTYGPLGFLDVTQLNYAWPALLSFAFTLVFSTTIFAALLWGLRCSTPLWLALPVAFVVGGVSLSMNPGPEDVLPLVLLVCVAILSRAKSSPAPVWVWAGLGVILGTFSLVKVSLSVGITAVLVVTVVSLPCGKRRAVGGLVLGALPALCLGWFGTGNGLGNLAAFVRASVSIVIGYGPAMAIEDPGRGYVYWWAAGVGGLIVLFTWFGSRQLPVRVRIGIGLATVLVLWFLFKEGFVRHDGHDLIFLAAAPIALLAVAPRRHTWVLVLGVFGLTAVTIGVAGVGPASAIDPVLSARNFGNETLALVSPIRRSAMIEQSRMSLRTSYAIPPQTVALMRGHTVDIAPWEQNVAWAYPEIRFDPLPVIQDYSAYTPWLDGVDRSYVASPDAPNYILRQSGPTLDGRNPAFEPPATQLAIECYYRQVAGNASWQLLRRRSNRCGPIRFIGSATASFDHWISLPNAPADDAVVASFGLHQGWGSSLESILFKPSEVFLSYNTVQQNWRFVSATAPDLHVLRPASTLAYGPGFTPETIRRFAFSLSGGGSNASVQVSFYAVPFAAPQGGR
jgi:hypothetical protein